MHDPAFSAPGRFWRGNLHTHSTRSDGVLDPGEVCRRYRAEGYDFISMTDHLVGRFGYPITDTEAYRDTDFTTIPGAELHSGPMENGDIWHILAVGLPPDFTPPDAPDFTANTDQETGPALARRARQAGAYVAVAHPEWGGLSLADARSIDAAHSIEVYNHGCLVAADRAQGFWHLDRLLEEGRRLTLCATDDAHFYEPDHFGGWTMVRATENTPQALVAALKAGQMYASTGPEFHDVRWEAAQVTLEISACTTAIVQGAGKAAVAVHGDEMRRVSLPLGQLDASPWMRLTIIDAKGRRAWTNPVWKPEGEL